MTLPSLLQRLAAIADGKRSAKCAFGGPRLVQMDKPQSKTVILIVTCSAVVLDRSESLLGFIQHSNDMIRTEKKSAAALTRCLCHLEWHVNFLQVYLFYITKQSCFLQLNLFAFTSKRACILKKILFNCFILYAFFFDMSRLAPVRISMLTRLDTVLVSLVAFLT